MKILIVTLTLLISFIGSLALLIPLNHVATSDLPTGRAAWQCADKPIIYPGWWDKKSGIKSESGGKDGSRTAGPSVIKLGQGKTARYVMYYLADQPDPTTPTPNIGRTRILRAETPADQPTNFTPKNVAMEFYGPWMPKVDGNGRSYSTEYYRAGPYYGAVLPDLDERGEPRRNPDGGYATWFMYYHTAGSALSVAVSTDGGITFTPPSEPGLNPLFPFEVFTDPKNQKATIRQPVQSLSKVYDQSVAGSASVVKAPDGRYILFYTARLWNYYTLDDLAARPDQVGHPDGHIPDYGIAYAESKDGLHFTRRTAMSLGVSSPAARGVGRIIEPRFHSGPEGELEYVVSRPMIFADGADKETEKVLYRMMVSSHSSTYRVRSLHSTDLINWIWDKSPAAGTFGFGAPGTFDDKQTSYAVCLRENFAKGHELRCWYTGNGYGHVVNSPTGIGYCSTKIFD